MDRQTDHQLIALSFKLGRGALVHAGNQKVMMDAAHIHRFMVQAFAALQAKQPGDPVVEVCLVSRNYNSYQFIVVQHADRPPLDPDRVVSHVKQQLQQLLTVTPAELNVNAQLINAPDLPDYWHQVKSSVIPNDLKQATLAFFASLGLSETIASARSSPATSGAPDNAATSASAPAPAADAAPATRSGRGDPMKSDSAKTAPAASQSQSGGASVVPFPIATLEKTPSLKTLADELHRLETIMQNKPDQRKAICPHFFLTAEPGIDLEPASQIICQFLNHHTVLTGYSAQKLHKLDIDWETLQSAPTAYLQQIEERFDKLSHSAIYIELKQDAIGLHNHLLDIMDLCHAYADKHVFIFTSHSEDPKRIQHLSGILADQLFIRTIGIITPTFAELFDHIRSELASFNIELGCDDNCQRQIRQLLDRENADGYFHYLDTAAKLAREIAYQHLAQAPSQYLTREPSQPQSGPVPGSGQAAGRPAGQNDTHSEVRSAADRFEPGSLTATLDRMLAAHLPPAEQSGITRLRNLIGLETIKQKIEAITAFNQWNLELQQSGLQPQETSLHMVFMGNPGTGKTEVARLLGAIYKEMGILKHGDFIEVSRHQLVGKYVGHTARITSDICEKAIGSVLFIDEAYALAQDNENDFGHEAIVALIQFMENHYHDTIVILAGYREEMQRMLSVNPGLSSRVSHQIDFPDYTAAELTDIFRYMMGKRLIITDDALQAVHDHFESLARERVGGSNFGNGRYARNLFERATQKLAERVMRDKIQARQDMRTLQLCDIQMAQRELQQETAAKQPRKNAIGFK